MQCEPGGIAAWARSSDYVRMAHGSKPKYGLTFLRAWREHVGLSLVVVADKMGITHGQLSKIERGYYPYNQNTLEVAARLYDCTVQDLLTRGPTDGEEIFAIWPRMKEHEKRRIIRIIKAVDDD